MERSSNIVDVHVNENNSGNDEKPEQTEQHVNEYSLKEVAIEISHCLYDDKWLNLYYF
jgi:hypothetical protein